MHRIGRGRVFFLSALVALAAIPAAGAGFTREIELEAQSLELTNLIGRIDVRGHEGRGFRVAIEVAGRDASPERVRIDVVEGGEAKVDVRFPLSESRRYVYPAFGGNASFSEDRESSWLAKLLGQSQIKVASSGAGLELWADVKVLVPKGKRFVLRHGVGEVSANKFEADLVLDTHVGSIAVDGASGALAVDTGSGNVSVVDSRGDLHIDTGSGSVVIRTSTGKVVDVDTGSGEVELDDVDASGIRIDTGSGSVTARGVGADEGVLDTGSGSVTLELVRLGTGSLRLDTGSGGIELRLPADASAELSASTGSGGIELNLSGDHRVRRKERDEVELTLGGGTAHVRLDAGSGSIRIRQ